MSPMLATDHYFHIRQEVSVMMMGEGNAGLTLDSSISSHFYPRYFRFCCFTIYMVSRRGLEHT